MQRRRGEKAVILSITPNLMYGGGSVRKLAVGNNYKVEDLHQMKGNMNHTGYHSRMQHHKIASGM